MPAEEWLELTPRLFHLMLRHSRKLMDISDLQHGILTSWIVNTGPYPPKTPMAPRQFMVLTPLRERAGDPDVPIDIGAKLRKLFGAH